MKLYSNQKRIMDTFQTMFTNIIIIIIIIIIFIIINIIIIISIVFIIIIIILFLNNFSFSLFFFSHLDAEKVTKLNNEDEASQHELTGMTA